jgi:hypothetical protein
LDLTLSATKTASPLVLMSVLNSLSCHGRSTNVSSANDNTANATNSNLKTIINNKLAALNLSGYNAQMIMNRAEAMSCGGKIIKDTRDIHLSKTPLFYCSIYCFLPVICQ